MNASRLVVLASLLAAGPAAAQSEAALREHFEGKTVTLKLAMPGTESGVDVYPADPKPLDYPKYASRLKENGLPSARATAMITRSGQAEASSSSSTVAGTAPWATRRPATWP
jgi:hypothetical protein